MTPPINQPIHPPTCQTIHTHIDGGVSTDFKSFKRIKFSQFVHDLLHFSDLGCLPLEGGWVKVTPTHMCICMHIHMLTMINILAIYNFYTCIFSMYACECVCMCACACICMHVGGTPHALRHPSPTFSLPRTMVVPNH